MIWVSSPLNLHSYNNKLPYVGHRYLPKLWGKKLKATIKVTLQEPPIKLLKVIKMRPEIKTYSTFNDLDCQENIYSRRQKV